MVRVSVDHERCTANGVCASVASAWFALGTDDRLTVDDRPVTPAHLDLVREAVLLCPTQALSLIEIEEPSRR